MTFTRVIKNKSTEEFSVVPYVTALLNCLIYSWYGSPVVSQGWDNLPLVTINGFGVLLELCFILIYFWFASPRGKKAVALIMAPVTLFCIAMFVSTIEMHDRHLRKAMVGSFGFVASIAMYGSPLVAMKQVIQTKSVEFMPFYLSFFSFLTSALWMAYGLLSNDLLLTSPNLLGCPLGVLQLVLYCIYMKNIPEEPYKLDLEKGEKANLITPLISDTSDVKNLKNSFEK
ncbi:hypothetical protein IFM89_018126 [Coptis chinensis]|uniref:Bidirectional sugar transporter SWEET n=1 Tax=Coptis chinensis TaxID=261450 RepID=A0A835HTM0_9MAGN|nr:hypothetical protein IFM89_018126 [Coptis chinensis]